MKIYKTDASERLHDPGSNSEPPEDFCWLRPRGKFVLQGDSLMWTSTRSAAMYEPMQNYDGLLYTLAKLDISSTPASIIDFGSKYGPLALPAGFDYGAGKWSRLNGGTIKEWMYLIGEISAFIEIWEAARIGGNRDALPLKIRDGYIDGTFLFDQRRDHRVLLDLYKSEHGYDDPEIYDDSDALAGYCEELVSAYISRKLRELTIPVFQKSEIGLFPHNLIGALWIQFAHAVANDESFERCQLETCSNWFLKAGRQMYCSNTCAQYASRRRKK